MSTTDLRTKAPALRDSLKRGEQTYLVHRSEIIGIVTPYENTAASIKFPSKNFRKNLKALKPSKLLTYEEREIAKRAHLEAKYGKKDIS